MPDDPGSNFGSRPAILMQAACRFPHFLKKSAGIMP